MQKAGIVLQNSWHILCHINNSLSDTYVRITFSSFPGSSQYLNSSYFGGGRSEAMCMWWQIEVAVCVLFWRLWPVGGE